MPRNSVRPTQFDIRGVLDVLDDAREALNDIASPVLSPTPRFFRRRVHEILNATTSARYAMDAITKSQLRKTVGKEKADAFEVWKNTRRNALDRDPVVVWFDEARDDFVHRAISPLVWMTHVESAKDGDFEPPTYVRPEMFRIAADGVWWVESADEPEERREFAHPRLGGRSNVTYAAVFQPIPASWPRELRKLTPVEVCARALAFYRQALREYYDEWWVERDPAAQIG